MKSPITGMRFDRTQVHLDMRAHRAHSKMPAREAVEAMWNLAADAYAANPTPRNLEVAMWAWDIWAQSGCEDFDPACDGYLTDLISIIIRG